MMQQYDFAGSDPTQQDTGTLALPSEQTIRTILDFARSYQAVEVEGVRIDIYLN